MVAASPRAGRCVEVRTMTVAKQSGCGWIASLPSRPELVANGRMASTPPLTGQLRTSFSPPNTWRSLRRTVGVILLWYVPAAIATSIWIEHPQSACGECGAFTGQLSVLLVAILAAAFVISVVSGVIAVVAKVHRPVLVGTAVVVVPLALVAILFFG
jgi:hypothetical protein